MRSGRGGGDEMRKDELIPVRDGDLRAFGIYKRHYSARFNKRRGWGPWFAGNGQKMVLLTAFCDVLFVWRKTPEGILCSVFRNESSALSSDIIRCADELADERWGAIRHYTYVDPASVCSANPGFCFLMAGWRRCGITARRQRLILERVSL